MSNILSNICVFTFWFARCDVGYNFRIKNDLPSNCVCLRYLCLYVCTCVQQILTMWVTWRVSYGRVGLLAIRECAGCVLWEGVTACLSRMCGFTLGFFLCNPCLWCFGVLFLLYCVFSLVSSCVLCSRCCRCLWIIRSLFFFWRFS